MKNEESSDNEELIMKNEEFHSSVILNRVKDLLHAFIFRRCFTYVQHDSYR